MPTTRLSTLDSSFLEVETPTAHMHVGWASLFDPPESGQPRPRPGRRSDDTLPDADRLRELVQAELDGLLSLTEEKAVPLRPLDGNSPRPGPVLS